MTQPIHVLHVDDNAAIRDLTAEMLERVSTDVTVTSVADPTTVPEQLETDSVDCVVSDYEMPERDGLDLCREIRESRPDLPFFLFTSHDSADLIDRTLEASATDYILKEPGVEQYKLLANRIENAVCRHRVQDRLAKLERQFDEQTSADGGSVQGSGDETEAEIET